MVNGAELLNNPDALTSSLGSATVNFGSTLYLVLWIALALVIVGGFGFFIWWWTSFKHTIKIKEKLGAGKYLVIFDKAKIKKTPEGEFWKFRRRKTLIGAPPSEALEVSNRGFYYAECVHDVKSGLDAGYDWIINPKLGKFRIQQTQEERALLADRLRRAQDRKSKSVLDVIMQLSGLIMCIMIVVSLLAFYGEITKSLESANKEQQVAFQRMEKIVDKQIIFQQVLNDLFGELSCEAPTSGFSVPLDQKYSNLTSGG